MNLQAAISTYNFAKAAGFAGVSLLTAVAIAGAESGFNALAIGDRSLENSKYGPSVGLWQIRSLKNPGAYSYPDNLRDANKLIDPALNAQAAYAISNKGTNFSPWSTYANKAYQEFVNIADQVQTLQATAAAPLSIIEIALLIIIGMKIFGGKK